MTSYEEFKALASGGNIIPVYEELIADTETPVSVYLKIRDESPYSFLLESVEGGEHLGRYSFIGYNPFMIFDIRDNAFSITPRHEDVKVLPALVTPDMHPLEALKTIFAHCKSVPVPGLPRLTGGAVGYFGYETIRLIEEIPEAPVDELKTEDATLMFFDTLLVFDALKRKVIIIANGYCSRDADDAQFRAEYKKAADEIARMIALLKKPIPLSMTPVTVGEVTHSVSKAEYCAMVKKAQEYIVEGDIFQVVPSQRLKAKFDGDPFNIYRTLRIINPSPYLYYFTIKDLNIIGSSPELLVRVENGEVETRPIAGTQKRGATPEEDAALEAVLMADQKERAEHLMLVDLGRNDIGRISEFGSVDVTQFMVIEHYSHVMHIVSNVKGKLKQGLTALDALYSCFPAGTLSGAPKIRAMEIIAELEPVKRGVYGGAIGYLDFSGNLDSCIAIRTIVVKDGTAYFQAGGGVVYDSVPENEYQETLQKMSAPLEAVRQLHIHP
ncbi:MAG TPA: anthranilate synthase component I [Bacteroidota bacterium]|nr:anthranilate synthase component I [Bacteroidota bacterium]